MGVFFGNDNPASATYNEIIPNLNERLNYWKQFKLTQIGKARVVEMFLASKLLYAIKFYPIPHELHKKLQNDIFEFINFPQTITIAQKEMWKIKSQGGIKLINIQVKSEITKVKWLIDICTIPQFKTNLHIFSVLMGNQKGGIHGRDLLFVQQSYIKRQLNTNSDFYKEALSAMAKFETRKGIRNLHQWDNEHLFYNPLFTDDKENTFTLTQHCEKNKIYTFEQLLEEKAKESRKLPFDKILINMFNKIRLKTNVTKEDKLSITNPLDEIKFTEITEKQLYEEAILLISTGTHHSELKWVNKLGCIDWKEVWNAVHNILSTNKTKNIIWQQLHLNFYTQYSYNKWHNTHGLCPLCNKIPESIYHIILHCQFTNRLWQDIEPTLKKIHPLSISDEEKAFGIAQKEQKIEILLRNWITYLLRNCISQAERQAYKSNTTNIENTKIKVKNAVGLEIRIKAYQYKSGGNLAFFDKIITQAGAICNKIGDGEYQVNDIFK